MRRPSVDDLLDYCAMLRETAVSLPHVSDPDGVFEPALISDTPAEYMACAAITLVETPLDCWLDVTVEFEAGGSADEYDGELTGYVALKRADDEIDRVDYHFDLDADAWQKD